MRWDGGVLDRNVRQADQLARLVLPKTTFAAVAFEIIGKADLSLIQSPYYLFGSIYKISELELQPACCAKRRPKHLPIALVAFVKELAFDHV